MWLQGYGTDSEDPKIVDLDRLKTDTAKLSEHCGKNPAQALISAAESVFDL
jgi:hypothetical protein